jgi:hypothetical protein
LLALSVSDFDLLKLVELDNGAGEVHNILASLLEGVETDEESVSGDLPLVSPLSLSLVLEVCLLELGACFESSSELIVSFLGLLALDAAEDGLTIDVLAALADDGVADLADQDHQASGRVVVRRVRPDHQDHVHDRDEQVGHLGELSAQVSQVSEKVGQGLQVLVVLVGLRSSGLHLLLELAEGSSVCGLVLLEELEDFLDALGVKLFADGVQVV